MARYLKVTWHHEFPDEGVVWYSELDDDRYETRKVVIFPDGRYEYADETHWTEQTELGEKATPTIEEIAAQREFSPVEIGPAEFEDVWQRARESDN